MYALLVYDGTTFLKSTVRVCRTIDYDQYSSSVKEKMMRLVCGTLSSVVLVKPIGFSEVPRDQKGARTRCWFQVLQLASTYLRYPGIVYPPDGVLLAQSSGTPEYIDKQDRVVEDSGVDECSAEALSGVHTTTATLRRSSLSSSSPPYSLPRLAFSSAVINLPGVLLLEQCDGDVFPEVEARWEKVCKGKDLVMEREPDTVFVERMLGEEVEDSTWSDGRRGEVAPSLPAKTHDTPRRKTMAQMKSSWMVDHEVGLATTPVRSGAEVGLTRGGVFGRSRTLSETSTEEEMMYRRRFQDRHEQTNRLAKTMDRKQDRAGAAYE
ncbi:hypothetical protein EDD18DRAFT_1106969 [Armillaria luteobubalina]|uniref:Uncharacterized protein n=1 Tax=Armillaria luteobubalina TaxID=153913 RepID=A0AA39Q266_9AGAR|nr:hypothetical protein EDD18DRAFT_1106969 [Armillaria luteobubalina]